MRSAAVLLLLLACSDPVIKGGSITIKNDIMDKSFNSFIIDGVITNAGAVPFRATLKPGDSVSLPQKHIRALRFTRQYSDHAKVYEVTCPNNFNKKIQVKLIDVHSNRIRGGCVLRRRGVRERGGLTQWED